MIRLASRLSRIQPSPTLAMAAKAAELKAQGRQIINLTTGEPDFDTPEHIKMAAGQAMAEGLTKYTPVAGLPALKKAIQAKLLRENKLMYDLSEITVSNGGKQAIFNAFLATLEKGDEVIIPAPYWVSYPDMVALCEATPIIVPCHEDTGFKITSAQLEAAISAKTKWIVLNTPSNPAGSLYTLEELKALATVLERHPHVWILSDDIYEHLIYEGIFLNLPMVTPTLKDRTLIVNGVSKAYSMTGWRIGYGAGPASLISAMTMLQSQSTSNACSISQAAAVAALNEDQSFLDEWRASFKHRRDKMVYALNHIIGLSCRKPEGAFYLYVSCKGLLGKKTPEGKVLSTDDDVCTFLLEHGGLAVVSGSGFGLSPYFRISYAISENDLDKAIVQFEKAINLLRS